MALTCWQKVRWLLAAILTVVSSASWAQTYVGANLGATFYNDAEKYWLEDESTAYELKGGVRLIDVLAIEMSYLNLGEFLDEYEDRDISYSGSTISAKAILPLGPEMDIYAKIGLFFWERDRQGWRRSYFVDEGESLVIGGGASFNVSDEISVDLEYGRFDLDFGRETLEVDLFSAGISLYFW